MATWVRATTISGQTARAGNSSAAFAGDQRCRVPNHSAGIGCAIREHDFRGASGDFHFPRMAKHFQVTGWLERIDCYSSQTFCRLKSSDEFAPHPPATLPTEQLEFIMYVEGVSMAGEQGVESQKAGSFIERLAEKMGIAARAVNIFGPVRYHCHPGSQSEVRIRGRITPCTTR